MARWVEDTQGAIRVPTPSSGRGGYTVDMRADRRMAGFNAHATAPQAISGLAIGLPAISRAADKWADLSEKQLEMQRRAEVLEWTTGYNDREREMFARMGEMKGKEGIDGAVELAEKFYEDENAKLLEGARGDFQRGILQQFAFSSRETGMNKAFQQKAAALQQYEEEAFNGIVSNSMREIDENPDNYDAALNKIAANYDFMYGGAVPPEKMDADFARFEKEGTRQRIAALTGMGRFDDARKAAGGITVPDEYKGLVAEASKRYGVPADVIAAVMQTESGFRAGAVSPTGVKGLMQVTQGTYKALGFSGDRADPINSTMAGAKLLGQLHREFGNWADAFAAYNGGPQAVKGMRTGDWGKIDKAKQAEVRNYVGRLTGRMGGALSREERQKLNDYIDSAETSAKVAGAGLETQNAFATMSLKDASLAVAQKMETLMSGARDDAQRADIMNRYTQTVRYAQEKQALTDYQAVEKFNMENENTPPELRRKAIIESQNLSQIAKDTLLNQIDNPGGLGAVTVESTEARDALMVAIDEGGLSQNDVLRQAWAAGMPQKQIKEALEYQQGGGKFGQKGLAGKADSAARLMGFKKLPPGVLNQIAKSLPPGKEASLEEIQKAVAENIFASQIRGTVSDSSFWADDPDNLAEALAAGKAGKFVPDVSKEQRAEADLALSAMGLPVNKFSRAMWHKKYVLGLELTPEESAELRGGE